MLDLRARVLTRESCAAAVARSAAAVVLAIAFHKHSNM